MELNKVYLGDCREVLKTLPENSVDSICCDPPYELGFMGKSWDNTGIANNPLMWAECLRVLKPGGYLLSFGGTRTYHRMASAIEDAGFEVRDQMVWCYGQGFPKSLNISLQIKKKYNIGLCTCNVFEPMIELGYENTNTTNNKGNGDYVGQGFSDEAQVERGGDKKTQSETGDKIISGKSGVWNSDGKVCELWETDTEKKQGLEKVGEVVLQQGVPQPINEKEGYGDIKIRGGVESNQTESQRERRDLQMLRKEGQEQSTSSPFDTIQNGREEYNGESSESLSELSQQDRENNRKRIEQIKNDCGTEEWNNLSRFICSKCHCIKKDIGGTALKPSIEPICMARKPLAEKTVAENVLKYGTGGINIDESRVGYQSEADKASATPQGKCTSNTSAGSAPDVDMSEVDYNGEKYWYKNEYKWLINKWLNDEDYVWSELKENLETYDWCKVPDIDSGDRVLFDSQKGVCIRLYESKRKEFERPDQLGRFPANLIHDNSDEVRECFPESNSGKGKASTYEKFGGQWGKGTQIRNEDYGDKGNASRFFKSIIYQAKSSKSDRTSNGTVINTHPTVKSVTLMTYLIKMVTPKGGIVLDPFAGSGSTLVAAKQNGFNYVGIEMTEEYLPIINARLGL